MRGRWLPCVILGSGQKEDTYDVRMQDPHQGPLDFPNVPAPFLRKAAYQPPSVEPAYEPAAAPAVEDEEPAPVFEPAVADEEPLPAVAAEPVAKPVVEEPLPAVTAEPAAKPAAEPPAATDSGVAFAVGAVVQLQVQEGPRAGDWITVSITGKGSKPDTYQVSTGFEELHDVPATRLRQSGTPDDWTI
uniref:Uncharacterized protein n=1 Tax=Pyrodinium bahamense TaxID=73915 RepID=A0A7S0FHN4_9DINO